MAPDLTQSEKAELDLRAYGILIFNRTKSLSFAVNQEILEPISKWIDDPDFMKKHAVMIDSEVPNWAEYKRRAREWTQRQKLIAGERLKLYWQEIRRKKNLRKELSKILGKPSRASPQMDISQDFLAPIISPFSPPEMTRQETLQLFEQSRTMSLSNRLPWEILIISDLTVRRSFDDLTAYCPPKIDKVSKLLHLLQMETDGKIKLNQEEPFGDISIEPLDLPESQDITIKDQQGQEYNFDWQDLSDAQRNKVIADIKENKILCKVA